MKLGLVLSGGASKCIAHLGVLKALGEIGARPSVTSAVSGSALLGSLVSAGISPDETMDIITHKANFSFYFPSLRSGGLFTMSRIRSVYEQHIPVKTFEELNTPLIISATNITIGKTEYFSEGNLIRPVIASSSYPIIFEPVEIEGNLYLDGGITNNFPVEILQGKCDKVLGVYVGGIEPMGKSASVQRVMFRSLSLAINESDRHRRGECDLLIDIPGLQKYPMFDFSNGKEIFDIGYQYTLSRAGEIEKAFL